MIEIQTGNLLKSLLNEQKVSKKSADSVSFGTQESKSVQEDVKNFSLNSLMDELFKKISSSKLTKNDILELLSDSVLKNSAKSIALDLKQLMEAVKKDKSFPGLKSLERDILVKAENITDSKLLKSALLKSGIFLESKLAGFNDKESVFKSEIKDTVNFLRNMLNDKQELFIQIDESLKKNKVSKDLFGKLNEIYKNNPKLDKTVVFVRNLLESKNFTEISLNKNLETALLNFKTELKKDLNIKVLIDKIMMTTKADKEFLNSLKELSSMSFKGAKEVKNIINLDNVTQKFLILENSVANDVKPSYLEMLSKDTLTVIKEIENIKGLSGELKSEITVLSGFLQNLPNSTLKEIPGLELSQKIQRVVNLLKQEVDLVDKAGYETLKLADRLTIQLKEAISNGEIKPNQQLQLPKNIKMEISNDIKAALLRAKDELAGFDKSLHVKDYINTVDRIINKIEYFQLLSFASDSNISYLPFEWDNLDEGKISIKKLKQRRYFCQIDLKLKDFGNIEIMVMLYNETDISISFFAENKLFLEMVEKNRQILKRSINSVGLSVSNIYFYDILRTKDKREDIISFVKNNQTGKGIDLQI